MSTTANNRVVFFAIAAGLLAFSLPLTWVTIRDAQITFNGSPFGESGPQLSLPSMGGMTFSANGFNGSMGLGVQLPIWLLVATAATAAAIGALNELRITSIPAAALLAAHVVVGVFFAVELVTTLGDKASLGSGFVMGVAGLALAAGLTVAQISPHGAAAPGPEPTDPPAHS